MRLWKRRKKPNWKRAHWRLPRFQVESTPVFVNKYIIAKLGQSLEMELERLGHPVSIVRHFRSASYDNFILRPKNKVGPILKLSLDLSVSLGTIVTIEANRQLVARLARDLREPVNLNPANTKLLTVNLGQAITGGPILLDIAQAPHVLVAGATGSGKSVCLNAVLVNLLLNNTPQNLQLTLIDLKRVELSAYRVPHLTDNAGFITEVPNAIEALRYAVVDMENRYNWLQVNGYRNVDNLNVPRRLIVIDEMADLFDSKLAQAALIRLVQKGRAAGVHLIVATQRPSVKIVTGLIKANIPTRIAFRTATQVDSRVILDRNGAERLLGKGDMILSSDGQFIRGQGAFVSDETIEHLVKFWRDQA